MKKYIFIALCLLGCAPQLKASFLDEQGRQWDIQQGDQMAGAIPVMLTPFFPSGIHSIEVICRQGGERPYDIIVSGIQNCITLSMGSVITAVEGPEGMVYMEKSQFLNLRPTDLKDHLSTITGSEWIRDLLALDFSAFQVRLAELTGVALLDGYQDERRGVKRTRGGHERSIFLKLEVVDPRGAKRMRFLDDTPLAPIASESDSDSDSGPAAMDLG